MKTIFTTKRGDAYSTKCSPRRYGRFAVLTALAALVALAPATAEAARTLKIYAQPNRFGNWTTVLDVLGGPANVKITVKPDGSTAVLGQVRYYDVNNKRVIQNFKDSVTVRVGNSISSVKVRLKGVPFGTACRVIVE